VPLLPCSVVRTASSTAPEATDLCCLIPMLPPRGCTLWTLGTHKNIFCVFLKGKKTETFSVVRKTRQIRLLQQAKIFNECVALVFSV
jgi:hypothetical protein